MRKTALIITVTICLTIVFIAAIGAWTYTQHQSIQQKDRALKQQTANLKYEQDQLNKRQQLQEICKYGNAYNKFGAGC
jgi:uncharacterized protein YpmB